MSESLFKDFEERVRAVCVDSERSYPLHEPSLGSIEMEAVTESLKSGWVSSVGPHVDAFEKMLSDLTSAPFVTATVNGTAALHVALLIAGIKPGEEVIIPPISFVATANAVAHAGAVPHFVEVEEDSLGMDPEFLRSYLSSVSVRDSIRLKNKVTGRTISAVIPVHIFGMPCRIDELKKVTDEFGLILIEDAAEALGSLDKGRHCGIIGEIGTLSFNGNKIVTTGGGGAIVTKNPELAKHAKHLSTTARVPHPWRYWHDEVGYNYRLPNINAALGCAQLKSLQSFLDKKELVAGKYKESFKDSSTAKLFTERKDCVWNHWLIPVRLTGKLENSYEDLLNFLHSRKILARPLWSLLHKLPMYQSCPRSELTRAEYLASNIICLPSSATLIE